MQKSQEEILNMDRWWIYHIYFHPRDKNGNISISAKPATQERKYSEEEVFKDFFLKMGFPDWMIDKKWKEVCKNGSK